MMVEAGALDRLIDNVHGVSMRLGVLSRSQELRVGADGGHDRPASERVDVLHVDGIPRRSGRLIRQVV